MSASQGSGQYWVYALPNPRPEAELRGVRLEAAGDAVVAIAGITLYHGQEHPLKRNRLESFRITLAANGTAAEGRGAGRGPGHPGAALSGAAVSIRPPGPVIRWPSRPERPVTRWEGRPAPTASLIPGS